MKTLKIFIVFACLCVGCTINKTIIYVVKPEKLSTPMPEIHYPQDEWVFPKIPAMRLFQPGDSINVPCAHTLQWAPERMPNSKIFNW